MNKRLIIIVLLIVLIIAGAWYGISRWQRAVILQGDRDVLLVNKREGLYTFLSTSDFLDIENNFKIVGYVDEYSEEELQEIIEGLSFTGSFFGENREIPGYPSGSNTVQTPEEEEQESWNQYVAQLTQEQVALCDQMPSADLTQYCTVRHGMFQAVRNQASVDICQQIFIEDYRDECIMNLEQNESNTLVDADSNSLLDSFEMYVGKAQQFTIQRN